MMGLPTKREFNSRKTTSLDTTTGYATNDDADSSGTYWEFAVAVDWSDGTSSRSVEPVGILKSHEKPPENRFLCAKLNGGIRSK